MTIPIRLSNRLGLENTIDPQSNDLAVRGITGQWGIDADGNPYFRAAGQVPAAEHAVLSLTSDGMPILTAAPTFDTLTRLYERNVTGRLIQPSVIRPLVARFYLRQPMRRPRSRVASIYPRRLRAPAPIQERAYQRRDDGRLMPHAPIHAPRPTAAHGE